MPAVNKFKRLRPGHPPDAPPDFPLFSSSFLYQLDISSNILANLAIYGSLSRLRDLLKDDPDCLNFLSSNKTDAMGQLNDIIKFGSFGQDLLPVTTDSRGNITNITNAVSGPTPLAPASAITVNPLGAFFYKNFLGVPNTTDNGRIRGGSFQAQAFISLHELGHSTDVLEHDAGIPAAGRRNDDEIDKNCKKTIKAAKQ